MLLLHVFGVTRFWLVSALPRGRIFGWVSSAQTSNAASRCVTSPVLAVWGIKGEGFTAITNYTNRSRGKVLFGLWYSRDIEWVHQVIL
jgi:hypothetical protein